MFCLTFHWLQIDELNGTLLTQLSKYRQGPFGSHLAFKKLQCEHHGTKANILSPRQKYSLILMDFHFDYHSQNSPPVTPILSQITPVISILFICYRLSV